MAVFCSLIAAAPSLASESECDDELSNAAALCGRERRPYFLPATTRIGDTSRDLDIMSTGLASSTESLPLSPMVLRCWLPGAAVVSANMKNAEKRRLENTVAMKMYF